MNTTGIIAAITIVHISQDIQKIRYIEIENTKFTWLCKLYLHEAWHRERNFVQQASLQIDF